MTVEELISALKKFDGSTELDIAYNNRQESDETWEIQAVEMFRVLPTPWWSVV